MTNAFHFGVCYYPEAWDHSRYRSDVDRIADAGFNYVRMGESAWSYWEPTEGHFQFELFDKVIDRCAQRGIKVILGTPTYACPAWVVTKYPEVLRWNFDRIPMRHGSRRNLNYTSLVMLDLSDRLCTALAHHYRGNAQVIGWQLDNEFNCHMDVSYAPSDTLAFQKWCERRYGSLDALNRAWGTRFWSQTFDNWRQIDLPHPTASPMNPSVLLDESRFISDTVVAFADRQAHILRDRNPGWFLTHNGLFDNVNGPDLVKKLDFFSHDQYPLFFSPWTRFAEVQARSLSFPFGIMEQQSGPGGQMTYLQRTPRPGELRLWTWQSIAHGANYLSYFRWRTCPYGAEQHWHGLIDADDRNTARLSEAKATGRELATLPAEFFTARPAKVVGVLRDYDNEIDDRRINTYPGVGRNEHRVWVAECMTRHTPVDELWTGQPLTGYRLLIAPHLKIIQPPLVDQLTAFVTAGGTLVLGAQSGIKDRDNHIVEAVAPGLLRSLAGVEIDVWTMLPDAETRRTAAGGELGDIEFATYVECVHPIEAESLARWTEGDPLLNGGIAITRRKLGRGVVYYLGGYVPTGTVAGLLDYLIPLSSDASAVRAGSEIESIHRIGDAGQAFAILLNHASTPEKVDRSPAGVDLTSGKSVDGSPFTLPPHRVRVISHRV